MHFKQVKQKREVSTHSKSKVSFTVSTDTGKKWRSLDVNYMFMHGRAERMEVYLVCSCQCNKGWILYLTVNARAPKDGDRGLFMPEKEHQRWRYLDYSCENLKRWRTRTVHATEFPRYI